MKASCWVLAVLFLCSARQGFAASNFTDPSSGTVIGGFEGEVNVTTITCNITSFGNQVNTQWNVFGRSGVSGLQPVGDTDTSFTITGDLRPGSQTETFRNRLIISVLTADLDGATIFCGTAVSPRSAEFSVRIYRPPSLIDNMEYLIEEDGSENIPINLINTQDPPAFPPPTSFTWTKDGETLSESARISLSYSNVNFTSVVRSDNGMYSVQATNFELDNPTNVVGTDTGNFTLNVLYGPSFNTPGPTERYVLLGDPLSLICGKGLDSNPQATITWTAPNETMAIVDNARYDLENGPDVVRLNFTHTIVRDTGTWTCRVSVRSVVHVPSGGSLVLQNEARIGTDIVQLIQLTVIETPNEPQALTVDSVGPTWVRICWTPPTVTADVPITYYNITARSNDTNANDTEIQTPDNLEFFNVTGLLPGTNYELSVRAVIQGGDVIAVSQPSESAPIVTGFTVPSLVCGTLTSSDGTLTVSWMNVHTGGLPLNEVRVKYFFTDGSTQPNMSVSVSGVEATSASVGNLVAGFDYSFTVTSTNSNGSSTITCGPIELDVGIPKAPTFASVRPGSAAGSIDISIKTVASGVNNPNQGFRFIITPILDSEPLPDIIKNVPDYLNGVEYLLTVSDLMPGRTYSFSARAMNNFGTSETGSSPQVKAAGITPPTTSPPAPTIVSNTGLIVGVAVAILVVIIFVIIAVLIVAVLLLRLKAKKGNQGKYPVEGGIYNRDAGLESSVTVREVPKVDIGTELTERELHYADLDTIRGQNDKKNDDQNGAAKPIEAEEPVEYATITGFKKTEDDTPASVSPPAPAPASDVDEKAAATSTTLV